MRCFEAKRVSFPKHVIGPKLFGTGCVLGLSECKSRSYEMSYNSRGCPIAWRILLAQLGQCDFVSFH